MKESKKQNINFKAAQYISSREEAVLEDCYHDLSREYRQKLDYWSATTFMANHHEMKTLFDDAFMKSLEDIESKGGDFVKLFHCKITNRYRTLIRDLSTRRKYEQLEVKRDGEEEAATSDIADDFNLAEEVTERITRKKKNDQRMLIEFLVSGENERTTAIVQTFLSTELKTPTAIGKHLGLDHKQVSRALSRLAAKYSTKQFGDYTEYLVAL